MPHWARGHAERANLAQWISLRVPARALARLREVFGWTERDNSGEQGNPLILLTGVFGHFIYLLPGDPTLAAPAMDHFGMMVETEEELDTILVWVESRAKVNDRVRIIPKGTQITRGPTHDYTLTNCYVGFGMPMLVELQHITRHAHARNN